MARLTVGEHERMLSVLMLKEVINPIRLHEATDEIEIRLAVLHAIFERWRRAGGLVAHIGEASVGEDLLDDGDGRHLRENLAVRSPREQPEPGPQYELVSEEILLCPRPARFRHYAVEVALFVVLSVEGDRRALPER